MYDFVVSLFFLKTFLFLFLFLFLLLFGINKPLKGQTNVFPLQQQKKKILLVWKINHDPNMTKHINDDNDVVNFFRKRENHSFVTFCVPWKIKKL